MAGRERTSASRNRSTVASSVFTNNNNTIIEHNHPAASCHHVNDSSTPFCNVQNTAINVRLSVCIYVHEHISCPNFTIFLGVVACGRASVLLWRRCDLLCTSGFVDDVTFAHNGQYLRRESGSPGRQHRRRSRTFTIALAVWRLLGLSWRIDP